MKFASIFPHKKTIIGMIHLPALPGYPGHTNMSNVIEFALSELSALEAGGIHGVLIENENDKPHAVAAPKQIIAAMSIISQQVKKQAKVPVGVEVLLNDPEASLAIANAAGLDFVRSDYFVDRMSRPEYGGEMTINPKQVMQYRKYIGADHILFLSDLQVKYAQLLEEGKTIHQSSLEAVAAGSDGLIVSGTVTGEKPVLSDVIDAHQAQSEVPVLVGSGFSSQNAAELLTIADGAIVGTSLKSGDRVDTQKVSELMLKVQSATLSQ